MSAVVVISLMFGAVIVMVKKADKEVTTIRTSGSSYRMRPNPDPRARRVTAEDFIRLKLINANNRSRPALSTSDSPRLRPVLAFERPRPIFD